MRALRVPSLIVLVGLASACKKKEEAPIPAAASVLPDSGGKIALTLGKPVEGVLGCGVAHIFVLTAPVDAQAKFELRIPKGAPQSCFHLNARDKAYKLLDSTISICSNDPEKFSSMQAPFGKDVTYFTIEPNDALQKCVAATYRVSVVK